MAKLVVLDTDFPDLAVEKPIARESGIEIVLADPAGEVQAVDDVVALVTMWSPIGEQLIESVPSLRVIGRIGLGVDAIDVRSATDRGIAVVNSGDYATEEVSVHAVGLLLALVRQIPLQDHWIRSGGWLHSEAMDRIRRLSSLRAGVIGLGNIGCRVASMLTALGMEVAGFDPGSQACPVPRVESLSELLAESDVVLLHVPLNEATHGLIGRRELALMKETSILINTGRGGLVDQGALVDALADGRLAGAGLDVFESEPMDDERLRAMPQVVMTPHVAYYSPDSLLDARSRTMNGIISVLEGRQPENQINQFLGGATDSRST